MWHTKQLILHGGVILLFGLLCGAPLGNAIVRKRAEETVRAWRVAHSSLVMSGIPLLALAGILSGLRLNTFALALLVWSVVASSYAFAVVLPLGALYGQRGLTSAPPLLNRLLYFGNIVGAGGQLLGTLVLIWAAYAAL